MLNPTGNNPSGLVLLQAEQIQAEFKVLALQHHPDKNSGDKDAEAKFQKLKVSLSQKLP